MDQRRKIAITKGVINLISSQLYEELKQKEIDSIEIIKSKNSLEILSPFYDIYIKKSGKDKVKVTFRIEDETFTFVFDKTLFEEILKETKFGWLIFEIMRNAKRVSREFFENSLIESYEFF